MKKRCNPLTSLPPRTNYRLSVPPVVVTKPPPSSLRSLGGATRGMVIGCLAVSYFRAVLISVRETPRVFWAILSSSASGPVKWKVRW